MNLSNEFEQYKLLKLTSADDITSVELVSEFSDDHIPCADAKINGIDVSLFYCGSIVIGALAFASESAKAKKQVFNALQCEISTQVNMMFDKCDDELADELKTQRSAYERALEYVRDAGPNSDIWSEVAGYIQKPDLLINTEKMTII